jgi:hypothetical protein
MAKPEPEGPVMSEGEAGRLAYDRVETRLKLSRKLGQSVFGVQVTPEQTFEIHRIMLEEFASLLGDGDTGDE